MRIGHFEREAYLQWGYLGFFVLGFLSLGLFYACEQVAEFVRVDICLDRGGSYDRERDVCDFEANHSGPG